MRLTEMTFPDAKPVEGYGPGFFRIGGVVIEGAMIVGPGGVRKWEGLADAGALTEMAGAVDFVFLGMGSQIAHAPTDVRQACEAVGLGLEVMASPTACRSYNVLLSEGRRVALAALPV